MLPYMIVRGERKPTEREASILSHTYLYLAGMGGRIAMPHSSLFITRILGKRKIQEGVIIHHVHSIYQGSVCRWHKTALSDLVFLYLEAWVFSKVFPKGYLKVTGQCVRNKCHTRSVTSAMRL